MSPDCCSCCSRATNTASMADENKPEAGNQSETRVERLQKWAAKQCLPIEAAVTTAIGATAGAVTGFLFDVAKETICAAFSFQTPATGLELDPDKLARCGGYRPLVHSFVAASRLEWARNYAVVNGVDAGISCVMKKLTGNDDVHTSMVAAFGSGVMVSLVTGMRGPDVLTVGVMFALMNGGHRKLKENLSQEEAQDKIRDMFSSNGLGVDHYATDFNTRVFADNALSLLTDRKETKKGHITRFRSPSCNFARRW